MAWELGWDMVSALGTVTVGIAAVYVAREAHKLSAITQQRARDKERRAMEAVAVVVLIEVTALIGNVEQCSSKLAQVIAEPNPESALDARVSLAARSPLRFSDGVVNAQAVHDLPESIGFTLMGAAACCLKAEEILESADGALENMSGPFAVDTAQFDHALLSMAVDALAELHELLAWLAPEVRAVASRATASE